jgi:hypothetical protein
MKNLPRLHPPFTLVPFDHPCHFRPTVELLNRATGGIHQPLLLRIFDLRRPSVITRTTAANQTRKNGRQKTGSIGIRGAYHPNDIGRTRHEIERNLLSRCSPFERRWLSAMFESIPAAALFNVLP